MLVPLGVAVVVATPVAAAAAVVAATSFGVCSMMTMQFDNSLNFIELLLVATLSALQALRLPIPIPAPIPAAIAVSCSCSSCCLAAFCMSSAASLQL